jgi:RimJ/RimL family protein N-acetyltransferase
VDPKDLKAIEENVGHASLPVIQHRLAHGAELHVLLHDGSVVGTRFFIMGSRHAFQHVILTEFDSMDIDGRIRPDFRGRGLNPLFFRMNIAHLRRQGIQRLYVACTEKNEASIRSFARVGFRFLATYKVRCGYHIYDPLAL